MKRLLSACTALLLCASALCVQSCQSKKPEERTRETDETEIRETTAETEETREPQTRIHEPYRGETWLEKTEENRSDEYFPEDLVIREIYDDCFFAVAAMPMPYQFKINGCLSEEWCVGDQVACTWENVYYDSETCRVEADLVTVEESGLVLDPNVCYKPVIYLYPETETEVGVWLDLNGKLLSSYPAYRDGWRVTAAPDGTLTDENGQTYTYLFWEADLSAAYDFSQGFCVRGGDTAAFLEKALSDLGLTRREANEFIVFWLEHMEKNPYNVISFQTEAYTDAAGLSIEPAPDTLIRVFMAWYPAEDFVEIAPQTLTAPARTGFTAVEWGGCLVIQ